MKRLGIFLRWLITAIAVVVLAGCANAQELVSHAFAFDFIDDSPDDDTNMQRAQAITSNAQQVSNDQFVFFAAFDGTNNDKNHPEGLYAGAGAAPITRRAAKVGAGGTAANDGTWRRTA